MIRYFPAVGIGTVTAEVTRILGIVPPEVQGLQMRGMDVFVGVELPPSPSDYWIIEAGTLAGEFHPLAIYARPFRGLAKGRNRLDLERPVAYPRDSVIAVRVRPFGSPATLTGCDVVLSLEEP